MVSSRLLWRVFADACSFDSAWIVRLRNISYWPVVLPLGHVMSWCVVVPGRRRFYLWFFFLICTGWLQDLASGLDGMSSLTRTYKCWLCSIQIPHGHSRRWNLSSKQTSPHPELEPLGDIWSSIATDSNKKIFNMFTNEIRKTIEKHQVSAALRLLQTSIRLIPFIRPFAVRLLVGLPRSNPKRGNRCLHLPCVLPRRNQASIPKRQSRQSQARQLQHSDRAYHPRGSCFFKERHSCSRDWRKRCILWMWLWLC